MSAITGRERRATAGRRMTDLVGKALEEDDAFWGHDTWNEEDSGNESFHDSDEDSAMKKDEFDSDFDDSESDNEDEEAAAGAEEEMELQKNEKRQQKKVGGGGAYVDVKTGKGKRGTGRKRIMGEGFNAGIVLNLPPQMADSLSMNSTTAVTAGAIPHQQQQQQIQQPNAPAAPAASNLKPPPPPAAVPSSQIPTEPATKSRSSRKSGDPVLSASTIASARERRSTHGMRKLRDNRSTPAKRSQPSTTSRKSTTQQPSTKSAKRKRYAQEELLLEAVHETEPENQRWLLGRKRVQDQTEKDANANALRNQQKGKIVQRFHSRRGCLITLTFPEMDAVPEILTRRPQPRQQQPPQEQQNNNHHHRHRRPLNHLPKNNHNIQNHFGVSLQENPLNTKIR